MNATPLRITLVQSNLYWENINANLEMFSQNLHGVKHTDLIVLPEMFSTGFSMNTNKLAEDLNGDAVNWTRETARKKRSVVTGSLMIKEDGRFYNRLVWMQPDGEFKTYDKRHLFTLSNEEQYFTAGEQKLIVELNGWKICPLICYDLRFPVWSRNKNSAYDMLLYVANWPERRAQAWKQLLMARAIENQSYVVGVNRTGNDGNGVYHSGCSAVVDPMGTVLYSKEVEEDIFTIQLELSDLTNVRKQLPFLQDADDFVLNPKTKFKSH